MVPLNLVPQKDLALTLAPCRGILDVGTCQNVLLRKPGTEQHTMKNLILLDWGPAHSQRGVSARESIKLEVALLVQYHQPRMARDDDVSLLPGSAPNLRQFNMV